MRKKRKLYEKAKEAYYNGEEIISDLEFDKLEDELGLSNKSYVGTKHNPSYTIKHPFIMGSLNKIQIHNFDEWDSKLLELKKYTNKYRENPQLVISPKYDGCSFELHAFKHEIKFAATRGDGYWGKDITKLIKHIFDTRYLLDYSSYILRGEVLVDKHTFLDKYIEEFKNPRSFVSGVINADYSEDMFSKYEDLSLVIYYVNYIDPEGEWHELDFYSAMTEVNPYMPQHYVVRRIDSDKELERTYNKFAKYRELCNFPLDGFVIKPISIWRNQEPMEYPDDCVAIKFIPQLKETTVVDIEWNLSKTNEMIPVIITEPVIMDGKVISRASAHNFGYIRDNNISIGSKVTLSLAGDIIPFIYAVNKEVNGSGDLGLMPDDSYFIKGCHLYFGIVSAKNEFINSAVTLNIPLLGEKTAKKIFEYIERKGRIVNHILLTRQKDIYRGAGRGLMGKKVLASYKEFIDNITLKDIVQSLNIRFCGDKVSNMVAAYLIGIHYDFSSMPEAGYSWAKNHDSLEYKKLSNILTHLNKQIKDFDMPSEMNKIPVILTGKPNNYKSKSDFLDKNPEYIETNSFSEAKIIFTGSMESTSNKMKKAMDKGVEIRLY